jgi:hypothetical protein
MLGLLKCKAGLHQRGGTDAVISAGWRSEAMDCAMVAAIKILTVRLASAKKIIVY